MWTVRAGEWFFMRRNYVPVVLHVFLVFWPYPSIEIERTALLWPLGGAILVPAICLRLWAVRYIGKRARTRKAGAKWLIRRGPFARVRNPIYIANMLCHAAAPLWFEMPWYAAVLVPCIFVHYHLIVLFEEHRLAELFGDEFRAYARDVPRWLPRPTRRGEAPPEPEPVRVFSWEEVLRREAPFLFGLASAVGAAVFKDWLQHALLG